MDISSILLNIPYLEKLLPFGIGDALSQGRAINASSLGILVLIFFGYRLLSGLFRAFFPSGTKQRTLWSLPTFLFSLLQYGAIFGALALLFSPETLERTLPGWKQTIGIWIFGVALLSAMFAILRTLRGTLTIGLWIIVVIVLGRAIAPNAFFPEFVSQISPLDLLAYLNQKENPVSSSQTPPSVNQVQPLLPQANTPSVSEKPPFELQEKWETTFSKAFSQPNENVSERTQQKPGLVYFSFAPSQPLLPRRDVTPHQSQVSQIPDFLHQLQERIEKFSIEDLPFFENFQRETNNDSLFFGRKHSSHFSSSAEVDPNDIIEDEDQITPLPLPSFENLQESTLKFAEKYHIQEWFQGSSKE